jgi:aspartate/methionine/tyrosine aminotransferase
MPTGAVLNGEHFDAIAEPVKRHGAWIIWDAAMERLVFGGRRPVHPGAHPRLVSRTITVGSASKELRMIGWRVGWVWAFPERQRHSASSPAARSRRRR